MATAPLAEELLKLLWLKLIDFLAF